MENINEILARAASLRDETALNSIDPERAGGIMYDTLLALNELWLQQGAALVISKIYASVAAMNADTSPVSDLTGKPIRPGMIVVIASSDSDNGSVYRYNGTAAPRWSMVGSIGNVSPVDSLDSDSAQLPLAARQGKVLDGKISQLGQKITPVFTDNAPKNNAIKELYVTGIDTPSDYYAYRVTFSSTTANISIRKSDISKFVVVSIDNPVAGTIYSATKDGITVYVIFSGTEINVTTVTGYLQTDAVSLKFNPTIATYLNSTMQGDIAQIQEDILVFDEDVAVSAEVRNDVYVKSNGDIGSIGSGVSDVYVYQVHQGEQYKILLNTTLTSGSVYLYAVYNTNDISNIGSANAVEIGDKIQVSQENTIVTIAQDGFLAVTNYYSKGTSVVKTLTKKTVNQAIQDIKADVNEIKADVNNVRLYQYYLANDVLKVAYGYGLVDLVVTLNKHGGNNLFDFANLSTMARKGVIGQNATTTVLSISTDWHAPFIVAAVNNIDGDDVDSHFFTGGNHQYNNTGSGSTPTARTTSLSFFADGRQITSGTGYANTFEIRWTNLVQGYNTKKVDGTGREILQENHKLIFNNGKIDAFVELIPLEDLVIETWYGYQYSGRVSIYPNTLFVGATIKTPVTTAVQSGDKMTNGVIGYGNAHRILMYVDNAYDLGLRYALPNGSSGAKTGGTNKSYFSIIEDLSMQADAHYYLKGGWEFSAL